MGIELLVLLGSMVVLICVGVPVFVAMGLAEAFYIIFYWPEVPLMVVAQMYVQGLNNYHFTAILFFFLAGEVMNCGGITDRLLAFSRACIGHIRGGLSHVNIVASMIFAGVSGSAMADASAIGSVIIPAMKREGYHGSYAAAVTAASSTIGPVIPPSVPLVLFGLFSLTSIGRLFIAGILPGLLMGLFLLVASYAISRRRAYPSTPWPGLRATVRAALAASLALAMPLIVVIGLVGGVATVSEVGAVAAAYGIVVSTLVYRTMTLSDLWRVACKVGLDGARVMIIVSVAGLFIWIVGNMGVAQSLADRIVSITTNPQVVLALMAFALLLAGTVLDPITLFVVFVPILVPTARTVGIDMIQMGVVSVLATLLGLITPPVGILVFVTSAQAGAPVFSVFREMIPFALALILLMAALILVPALTTGLPNLLMG
jgi:tripartite ATP-independent transporter DctM subunit